LRRRSSTTYSLETVEEYKGLKKSEQDNIKDVAGLLEVLSVAEEETMIQYLKERWEAGYGTINQS
jgi:hypothetical protein